jgi:hypothetical protein
MIAAPCTASLSAANLPAVHQELRFAWLLYGVWHSVQAVRAWVFRHAWSSPLRIQTTYFGAALGERQEPFRFACPQTFSPTRQSQVRFQVNPPTTNPTFVSDKFAS